MPISGHSGTRRDDSSSVNTDEPDDKISQNSQTSRRENEEEFKEESEAKKVHEDQAVEAVKVNGDKEYGDEVEHKEEKSEDEEVRKRPTSIVKPAGNEELEFALTSEGCSEMNNKNITEQEDSLNPDNELNNSKDNSGMEPSISFSHESDDIGVSSLNDLKIESLGADSKLFLQNKKYSDIREKHKALFNNDNQGSNVGHNVLTETPPAATSTAAKPKVVGPDFGGFLCKF